MTSQDLLSKDFFWHYTSRLEHLVNERLADHPEEQGSMFLSYVPEGDYIEYLLRSAPYKSSAITWLRNGAWMGALILLPFGPMTFFVGMILGSVCGVLIGLALDLIKFEHKHLQAKNQKKRINHLMRWAEFHFAICKEQIGILLRVALEYEALIYLGAFSRSAHRQIRLLYRFLKREDVQDVLSNYVNFIFLYNTHVTTEDILFCNTLLNVYIHCYTILNKPFPATLQRIQDTLQQNPSLVDLFNQAQDFNQEKKKQNLENLDCLIYADDTNLTAPVAFWKNLENTGLMLTQQPFLKNTLKFDTSAITSQNGNLIARRSTDDIDNLTNSSNDEQSNVLRRAAFTCVIQPHKLPPQLSSPTIPRLHFISKKK